MTDLPSLLVGVPVLGRPANAAPLVSNLRETTPSAKILFICSRQDKDEIAAINALGLTPYLVGEMSDPGQFATKHNAGYKLAVDGDFEAFEWYFCGADDLTFHAGWFEACLEAHRKTGACVIGTKDLGNQRTMTGWHATHFLVHRDYLECGTVDEDGKLLNEAYSHEFCDDECIATARWRRTYAPSLAVVEHLHPDWGKAEWDDTYRKAQADRSADRVLFESRRHLFGRGRPR